MNDNFIKKEIGLIKERNSRVEADKAWETSWTRKLLILLLTYAVIVVFFLVAELPDPFLNALVPSIAFVISTFTVGFVKSWWLRKVYKK